MHFAKFPEKCSTACNFKFNCGQIKGEYQFTYLEHALCVGGGSKSGKMIYHWREAKRQFTGTAVTVILAAVLSWNILSLCHCMLVSF